MGRERLRREAGRSAAPDFTPVQARDSGKCSQRKGEARSRPAPIAFLSRSLPARSRRALIVLAVRWDLRFGCSFRDVEKLLVDCGIAIVMHDGKHEERDLGLMENRRQVPRLSGGKRRCSDDPEYAGNALHGRADQHPR